MKDTIYREDAIEILNKRSEELKGIYGDLGGAAKGASKLMEILPSAQPERIIYANMSDEEFEKWLYEHGICNPNIHESISCDVVPLLIDNAISELPSAQPEIILCKDCKHRQTDDCPMYYEEWIEYDDDGYLEHDYIVHDNTKDDGFCDRGERKDDD